MIGSLVTGISGLKVNSQAMTVIGDNIANVNTIGFKANRVSFMNVLGQSLLGQASVRYGSGVAITGVFPNWQQGSMEATNNPLDLAVNGAGFFGVADEQVPPNIFYTRAGEFNLDKDGFMKNPEGLTLQAYKSDGAGGFGAVPEDILIDLADYAAVPPAGFRDIKVEENGIITGIDIAGAGDPEELFKISLFDFQNLNGLIRRGGNLYQYATDAGPILVSESGENDLGNVIAGSIEMSNVDLATEFVRMIVTQRAYQANARVISTSDEILQELMTLKR